MECRFDRRLRHVVASPRTWFQFGTAPQTKLVAVYCHSRNYTSYCLPAQRTQALADSPRVREVTSRIAKHPDQFKHSYRHIWQSFGLLSARWTPLLR